MKRGWSLGFVILTAFLSGCSTLGPPPSDRGGFFAALGLASGRSGRATFWEDRGELSVREVAVVRERTQDWAWPLATLQVTSPFGDRRGRFHDGVDLRAPMGTVVYAVDDGMVIHSASNIRGYGRMVLIRHDSGLISVYAHNSRNLVKSGQRVRKGQRVALSGRSGRTSGPHLHFEIRRGLIPIDPMEFLPRRNWLAENEAKTKRKPARIARAACKEDAC